VALVGKSGAGKSTMVKLLLRFYDPSDGKIEVSGVDIRKMTKNYLRSFIGVVPQDFRLLPQKTVFENIAFALEVSGEEDLIAQTIPALLDLVGLSEKKEAFPPKLSGGEAQRLAIARALVHSPKILIADEATGNLDPKNSRGIAELLARLNKDYGLTILFSTHDPVLVKALSPRVIRLEEGRILFDKKEGSFEEAFDGLL